MSVQALQAPERSQYDVVIVGGGIIGASTAWFLSQNPDFSGTVLVVEKDPSYEFAATAHTNSCMRQQFSTRINIQVSQFAAEYVRHFQSHMGNDPRVPPLAFHCFGYMTLANSQASANILRECQSLQAACGAATRTLTPEQIERDYPFYHLDDIVAANHNRIDEGYFDSNTMFDWWRRLARERGVRFLTNEVMAMSTNSAGTEILSVTLKSGETVACQTVVNASGPRARLTAAMAGIAVPIEPRKRFTYIFSAQERLAGDLPLTVDPSGVHVRTDGQYYMAGCAPEHDPAVGPDDFSDHPGLWEDKVWPALAHRIPQFEAIKLVNSWVGHYSFNTLDHNAVLGRHDTVKNFIFANGFSGHGTQQSPAMGRGVAELIVYGHYQTLDLSAFGFSRILRNEALIEKAVI